MRLTVSGIWNVEETKRTCALQAIARDAEAGSSALQHVLGRTLRRPRLALLYLQA